MPSSNIFKYLRHKSHNWKLAASINCAILSIVSITLIGLSVVVFRNGYSETLLLHDANCESINFGLHLIINIVSTLVVGSFCY